MSLFTSRASLLPAGFVEERAFCVAVNYGLDG